VREGTNLALTSSQVDGGTVAGGLELFQFGQWLLVRFLVIIQIARGPTLHRFVAL